MILKPVQSRVHGGVSDVLRGLCGGSKIPPLCNVVVMANVLDRWVNANNAHIL